MTTLRPSLSISQLDPKNYFLAGEISNIFSPHASIKRMVALRRWSNRAVQQNPAKPAQRSHTVLKRRGQKVQTNVTNFSQLDYNIINN